MGNLSIFIPNINLQNFKAWDCSLNMNWKLDQNCRNSYGYRTIHDRPEDIAIIFVMKTKNNYIKRANKWNG